MKTKITLASFAMVICAVSAAIYLYARDDTATIPQVELDSRFAAADTNRDGILSRGEFDAYLIVMRGVKTANVQPVMLVSAKAAIKSEKSCGGESEEVQPAQSKMSDDCCDSKPAMKAEHAKPDAKPHSGGGCCGK
jgi:hypothetical protein